MYVERNPLYNYEGLEKEVTMSNFVVHARSFQTNLQGSV